MLLLPTLASTQLPEQMVGHYQLTTSQGFEDFMEQIGVNWVTRKVGPGDIIWIVLNPIVSLPGGLFPLP